MPELPEVQTVVRTLGPTIVGQRIEQVQLFRTDILDPARTDLVTCLRGRTIHSIDRRAKRIVFTLDNANRFYIHLGMSGSLNLTTRDAPLEKHTHLILRFASVDVRFVDPRRFGGIWWRADQPCDDGLGPEPLTISPKELRARLANTKRAIKSALLDQSLIAGLGNIYVDESLFDARIHPLRRADRLDAIEITRLTRSIKRVLTRALKHRGSTLRNYRDANGQAGGFQKLFRVYDRADEPCALCKTSIKRIIVTQRSTHFCPTCQPLRKKHK